MEKNLKNQKLTIIVASLLVVIGVSFSYFIATTLINGKGSSVVGTTARIKGAEINIEGTLEFNDLDVLPGHKNVSAIKVTAIGNNQLIPYHLVWKGESGISQINYTVYKSSTPKTLSTNCERKTGVQNGMQVLSEECTISNLDTLGETIASGFISKGDTKEILAQDEFITATSDGQTVYYYVVLEYPNLDEDQSSDANATFNGEVTVEESNKEADINILAVYVADNNGNYTETVDIPQSGYQLNNEKSTCSNDATVRWDYNKKELITSNLTKSGTSCYLYFDEYQPPASETILANLTINTDTPSFGTAATTDEGVYKVSDGMYGDYSYYWRGAVTNNYVKFANLCWRIVRINGDGSIRLIYDGATCHANGTSTTESIAIANQPYNSSSDRSEYVGWTYSEGLQRPVNNIGTSTNVKKQIENWYNEHLISYDNVIDNGKYCNDRNVSDTWNSTGNIFFYAAYDRLYNKNSPTFNCPSHDIYTVKIGLITADEVAFAGGWYNGSSGDNYSYYLYNGQNYWTMTPFNWNSNINLIFVNYQGAIVNSNGSYGIRPVINLKSDMTISSGEGTLNNPYIVQ